MQTDFSRFSYSPRLFWFRDILSENQSLGMRSNEILSFLVWRLLGPVQTPLHSCAEPNWWIKYGKRAASESIWYGSFSLVRQKRMLLKRGTGSGERKSGNELSAETSTKIQNGGPKNEREKEDDKERNSCLGWNQMGTKLQIRLTFYVYVLSRWYVSSISNLFHLQYDKVLGLSFRDTWHTHITPGLLRLL